jgi:hypothetical protein
LKSKERGFREEEQLFLKGDFLGFKSYPDMVSGVDGKDLDNTTFKKDCVFFPLIPDYVLNNIVQEGARFQKT